MSRKTTLERFEAKFEPCPNTGCWLWTGATNEHGYGLLDCRGTTKRTHRLAYELYVGEIRKDLCVCHKCDIPWCVNPEHLFLGTHQENMIDRTRKGRCVSIKLSPEQILDVYKRAHAGERQGDIATNYGVTQAHVSNIKNGQRWAHLTKASP